MRTKSNRFTDEQKLQIVQEYLHLHVSEQVLMKKYNFGGKHNISDWMRKFDLKSPRLQQVDFQPDMTKQNEKTPHDLELEAKVLKLERELTHERLRVLALNTLIDVAERDLKISIRKKAGAKR
jgi:transposase